MKVIKGDTRSFDYSSDGKSTGSGFLEGIYKGIIQRRGPVNYKTFFRIIVLVPCYALVQGP